MSVTTPHFDAIYNKIKIEYPNLPNDARLSLSVHALNNTAGPNGLFSTVLVFDTFPKIPLINVEHITPNQRDRFAAFEAARREMETIICEHRLKLASRLRSKPTDVSSIPTEAEVLVYREKSNMWEGSSSCISTTIIKLLT